ncbi:unnamed protein product [Rotaria sp. Silwood2]|nr:unnamed protein product [Rotaria sp. Silwood2]
MQLNLYDDNNNNNNSDCDDLSKQLTIKTNIIDLYNNHIQNAILTIENSQKLVDLMIFNGKHISTIIKVERHKALQSIHSNINSISKFSVNDYFNRSRFKLSFHNLLVHKDTVIKQDQGIKLLQLMMENYQDISIQFQPKSETLVINIIQSYKKYIDHVNLHMDDLNRDELFNLRDFINSNETIMDITMIAKKPEQYQDFIQKCNRGVTINISINQSMKFLTKHEALDYMNQNTHKQIASISFTSINSQFFAILIGMSLDDIFFSLTFNKLSSEKALNVIKIFNKPIAIEFTSLNIEKASKLLESRKERDFLVCLNNLRYSEARRILEKFDPNEQDVDVILNKLEDNYYKNDKLEDELFEFDQHSINKLIFINELNPIPWFSVMTMTTLATAQIIGGVCLTAFTCGIGFTLGLSLINEGVNDLYFAVRGCISRDINWKDYAIQKGVSLAICFCTLGVSVVAQSARAAQQVGTRSTSQFLKQTWNGTKNLIRTSFASVAEDAIETTARNSLRLACKQVAIVTAETGTREVLNYSSDYILNNHLLAQIKSDITNYVESSMDDLADKDLEYKKILETFFFIDTYNQNHQLQTQMEYIAFSILNSCNDYIEIGKSFANSLSNVFLSHFQSKGGTMGNILQITQKNLDIIKTVQNALQTIEVTKKFFHAFKDELEKLAKGMPDLVELLSKEQNIGREVAETILFILKEHKILNKDGSLNKDSFPENTYENLIEQVVANEQIIDRRFSIENLKAALQTIDLIVFERDYKSIVINFFVRSLNNTYQKSMFQQKIYSSLVNQLMSLIQGVFIGPIKKFVLGKMVQIVSEEVQKNLDTNHETVRERMEDISIQRYINRVSNKFVNDVQCGKIKIEANAKEKLNQILQKSIKDRNELEKLVLNVLGNEEGGVIELGLISAMTGLKFSVIQDKECDKVIEDDGKIRLLYVQTKETSEHHVCHDSYWKSIDGSDFLCVDGSKGSLYNAIYSQASDKFASPVEIRTRLAEFMLANSTFIERILPAVNIINSNSNPIRRKTLLMKGGYTKIDISVIETPSITFKKLNNSGPAVRIETIKKLFKWININSKEITLLIEIVQNVFPKLISLKSSDIGIQCVTFIKAGTNLFEKYQNRDVIGTIEELQSIGEIILKFHQILKN